MSRIKRAEPSRNWFEMKATQPKKAEIMIFDRIGKDHWDAGKAVDAKKFIKELKALGDLEEITLRINSPGGEVYDGNAIYNALMDHPAKIHVKVDGLAASMASIIAMAGDTVEMPKNAMLMIHNPISGIWGNAKELRKHADLLDRMREGAISAYEDKTGLEREKIGALMDDTTWMTAEEACKLGFCDVITAREKAVASIIAQFDLSAYLNVPAFLLAEEPEEEEEPAGDTEVIKNEDEGEQTLMDKDTLMKNHPELYQEILNEGVQKEAERIKSIEELPTAGFETIVNSLKFDGKTTAAEVALQVISAQKKVQETELEKIKADGAKMAAPSTEVESTPQAAAVLSLEEKCKQDWEKKPELHSEYMSLESYQDFTRAEASGQVKFFKK